MSKRVVETSEAHPGITRQQETFLLAYIALPTMQQACKQAGCSHDAAESWMRKAAVRDAYHIMRQQFLDESLAMLISFSGSAIRTLVRNMREDNPPQTQVRAAQILLEQSVNVHKMSLLEHEIEELRTILAERAIK